MKGRAIAFMLALPPSLVGYRDPCLADDPRLTVTSPPQTLYRPVASGCSPNFIPDSPVRAFRRADGGMELIAAHYDDWRLVGPNPSSLKLDCKSILAYDTYHRFVPGRLWIQATYTLDGRHVYGFASQDLSSTLTQQGCKPYSPGRCWVNQMLNVRSDDMGADFAPGAVVASYGDKYPDSEKGQFGFFTSTNIVHSGSDYYVIFFQSPPQSPALARGVTQSGSCLFRSADVTDPKGWRPAGALETVVASGSKAECQPIVSPSQGPLRSIEYSPKYKKWIALTVGRHKLPGDANPVAGFYSITSTDLVHWGNLTRVVEAPLGPKDNGSDIYSYPSLLDPESRSANFETLDHDTAILLFTDHHLSHGVGTMNRDLRYYEVHVN